MKIEINKKEIQSFVPSLKRIVDENVASEENFIFMEAKDSSVVLRSANVDSVLEITLKAKVEKEGACYVSAQILEGVVLSITSDRFTIEKNGQVLNLKSGVNSSSIRILNPEGYEVPPVPQKGEADPVFEVPGKVLVEGMKSVQHAIASGLSRQDFSVINMYQKDREMVFVATDVMRLAEYVHKTKDENEFSGSIHSKTVQHCLRIFESTGVEGNVSFSFTGEGVLFFTQQFSFFAQLVQTDFPEYRKLIPKEKISTVTLLKSDIGNFLKRAYIFSNSFNRVDISVENSEMNLTVENEEKGSTEDVLKVKQSGESSISIPFNYRFIADAIQQIKEDSIVLTFSGEQNKPMVIQGLNNKNFTSLIVPLIKRD